MFPAETSTANGHLPDPPQNVPPTLLPLPLPPPGGDKGIDLDGNNYVNYDEKWNVEEAVTEEPDSNNPKSTKSMPGTMVLVIGIILGAFVAMILIVIIVLKMRTRMDGTIKGEEPVRGAPGQPGGPGPLPVGPGAAPRYQFSNAGPADPTWRAARPGGGVAATGWPGLFPRNTRRPLVHRRMPARGDRPRAVPRCPPHPPRRTDDLAQPA